MSEVDEHAESAGRRNYFSGITDKHSIREAEIYRPMAANPSLYHAMQLKLPSSGYEFEV